MQQLLSSDNNRAAFLSSGNNKAAFSLREIAATLFRRKKLIAVVFLTTLATVTVGTMLLPDRYESRLKVLVKNTRAEIVVSGEQTNQISPINEVSEAQVNSEIELIRSRDLLAKVVKKAGLTEEFARRDAADSPVVVEKAVRRLEKDLQVTPVKKASIIEIKYQSRSPERTTAVLRALAEAYLEQHLLVHRVPGTDDFFKDQAAASDKQLREAEATLAAFEERHNIVLLDAQKEQGLRRVLETEANFWDTETAGRETAQRIEKLRQQLEQLDQRIVTQQKAVPHKESIERLHLMLVELRHKRTHLLTRFQPEDRLVKEVEQQIAETSAAAEMARQQESVEQTSDVNPMRQTLELELARARVDLIGKQTRRSSLAQNLKEFRGRLANLEATTLKHTELERQVKEFKDNYHLFAKKRDEAMIAAALDKQKISNVALAETASLPALPAGPNRPLHLLLGLFLAGFLSLGACVGAEFMRDTVHTPRELEAIGNYPVLATTPFHQPADKDQNRRLLGPAQ